MLPQNNFCMNGRACTHWKWSDENCGWQKIWAFFGNLEQRKLRKEAIIRLFTRIKLLLMIQINRVWRRNIYIISQFRDLHNSSRWFDVWLWLWFLSNFHFDFVFLWHAGTEAEQNVEQFVFDEWRDAYAKYFNLYDFILNDCGFFTMR